MIKCNECIFDVDGVECSALKEYKINACKFFKDKEHHLINQYGFIEEREEIEDGETKAQL